MKKLSLYTFVLAFFMMLITACEKDRRFPEFENLEYGAIPRLVSPPGIAGPYGNSFNYFDVAGSYIEFTVEFYDENNGKNVSGYSWTVSYDGGTPVAMASADASGFGTNAEGLPTASFKFTFQEVLTKLGLTIDDVDGGKSFEFLATLTKNNGKVFTRDNTTANLQGQPAFRALFQNKVPIICPSDLGGTYTVVTTYAQHDFLPDFAENTMTMEIEALGNGVYKIADASGGLYANGPYSVEYGTTGLPFEFTDACGKISWQDQVDPWQTLEPVAGMPNFVDDNGVITITMQGTVYKEQWTSVYTPQ